MIYREWRCSSRARRWRKRRQGCLYIYYNITPQQNKCLPCAWWNLALKDFVFIPHNMRVFWYFADLNYILCLISKVMIIIIITGRVLYYIKFKHSHTHIYILNILMCLVYYYYFMNCWMVVTTHYIWLRQIFYDSGIYKIYTIKCWCFIIC